ncbi:protein FAR1-RELATED SEQUENCE 5-like [Lotus japonicus]|uniref:protein FAR1-RELATED SEQUENCE 5-like n=1 Tax=Lotus japonicus TaxID=34305 RepID=UPI00258A9C22|nr:protein FAR1-RELATED SEQUENCE 5-like [Lotus japonicus]
MKASDLAGSGFEKGIRGGMDLSDEENSIQGNDEMTTDDGTQYGSDYNEEDQYSDYDQPDMNESPYSDSDSSNLSDHFYGYGDEMNSDAEEDDNADVEDINVSLPNAVQGMVKIDNLQDILGIDLKQLVPLDLMNYEFLDSEVAYLFYHWYGRVNGFAVRKSRKIHNKEGLLIQRNFVCHKEGLREDRGLTMDKRQREPRSDFRCGCTAKFRVHVDTSNGRWYAKLFTDVHNHVLEEDKMCGMIAAHRKMNESDILHMNNMSRAGVSTPHIHSTFANQTGGFQKVRFSKENMYNVQGRQRRKKKKDEPSKSDAEFAISYISGMGSKDPLLYCRHIANEDGNLDRLFWSDGISQLNYQIFGDVVAFDATYGKNRYKCPFVVFCGVNHHNKSTIFATALVSNEKIETYVWLLERFLEAMKGKAPMSVITDGDRAMKAAIKQVYPNAHHRLCAWHILDNARKHVHIPEFITKLRKCMFTEFDVSEFEDQWAAIVAKFRLEENVWVQELYERRMMWAAAHMRGRFFAGFRTTSRCEALHSQIGKFVKKRYNLTEFVQHFHRCLNYLRYKEIESDFNSSYGKIVPKTKVRDLEKSAAAQFTKGVFLKFRMVLERLGTMIVLGFEENMTCTNYIVTNYPAKDKTWHVSYHESTVQFTCSCYKMETHGLPCDHLVAVLVYLGIREMPKCLVLDRWTKSAKHGIRAAFNDDTLYWDSHNLCQYSSMVDHCHYMCNLSLVNDEEIHETRAMIAKRVQFLKLKYEFSAPPNGAVGGVGSVRLGNPTPAVRDDITRPSKAKGRRPNKCSRCKVAGHNKKSCPQGLTGGRHGVGTSHAGTSNNHPGNENLFVAGFVDYGGLSEED